MTFYCHCFPSADPAGVKEVVKLATANRGVRGAQRRGASGHVEARRWPQCWDVTLQMAPPRAQLGHCHQGPGSPGGKALSHKGSPEDEARE